MKMASISADAKHYAVGDIKKKCSCIIIVYFKYLLKCQHLVAKYIDDPISFGFKLDSSSKCGYQIRTVIKSTVAMHFEKYRIFA